MQCEVVIVLHAQVYVHTAFAVAARMHRGARREGVCLHACPLFHKKPRFDDVAIRSRTPPPPPSHFSPTPQPYAHTATCMLLDPCLPSGLYTRRQELAQQDYHNGLSRLSADPRLANIVLVWETWLMALTTSAARGLRHTLAATSAAYTERPDKLATS